MVRLVKEGDRYVLSARDTTGGYGDRRRTTCLDPTLSDEELCGQVCEFLRAQNPCGEVISPTPKRWAPDPWRGIEGGGEVLA